MMMRFPFIWTDAGVFRTSRMCERVRDGTWKKLRFCTFCEPVLIDTHHVVNRRGESAKTHFGHFSSLVALNLHESERFFLFDRISMKCERYWIFSSGNRGEKGKLGAYRGECCICHICVLRRSGAIPRVGGKMW